jgi:hypothetical protein
MITYKTILFSKASYSAAVLSHYNKNYLKKWESILCRLLKSLLNIKGNICKRTLFDTLRLDSCEKITEKSMEKLYGIEYEDSSKSPVDLWSLKTIKLKLNCLFRKMPAHPV